MWWGGVQSVDGVYGDAYLRKYWEREIRPAIVFPEIDDLVPSDAEYW